MIDKTVEGVLITALKNEFEYIKKNQNRMSEEYYRGRMYTISRIAYRNQISFSKIDSDRKLDGEYIV